MKRFGGLVVFCLSFAASLAAGELMARALLEKVDYLEPTLSPHPVLGHVIAPYAGGHDAWGFRNPAVPERADVVAIGDSLTYGNAAPSRHSWPAWLGRLTGREVYNLALGGYSAPDYKYLFEHYVERLGAGTAVFGFYLGNDLPGAHRYAVGRVKSVADMSRGSDARALGALRHWLARNSVLYQASKQQIAGLVRALRDRAGGASGGVRFDHPLAGTRFAPAQKLAATDQSQPDNRIGLATSLALFEEIEAGCRAREILCLYLLLPSKEAVLWPLAAPHLAAAGRAHLARAVEAEDRVREAAAAFFAARQMRLVDPLAALRAAAETERIYRPDHDEHPIAAGYRVIAAEVAAALRGLPQGRPAAAAERPSLAGPS